MPGARRLAMRVKTIVGFLSAVVQFHMSARATRATPRSRAVAGRVAVADRVACPVIMIHVYACTWVWLCGAVRSRCRVARGRRSRRRRTAHAGSSACDGVPSNVSLTPMWMEWIILGVHVYAINTAPCASPYTPSGLFGCDGYARWHLLAQAS